MNCVLYLAYLEGMRLKDVLHGCVYFGELKSGDRREGQEDQELGSSSKVCL